MSGTIVQERARRQETWALLPTEADADRAGEAKAAEVDGGASENEDADEEDGNFVAAQRGFFKA